MDKLDYPGNSEKDKIERATVGAVKRKVESKPSVTSDMQRIASDIGNDILLPAAKTLFTELISNLVNMVLYGDRDAPRGRGGRERRPNVRYGGYYQDRHIRPEPEPIRARSSSIRDKVDLMVYDRRQDAVEVLRRMRGRIDQYDAVTVGDLYGLAGITAEYTDNAYGWYSLDTARVVPTSGGHIIDLPNPIELE